MRIWRGSGSLNNRTFAEALRFRSVFELDITGARCDNPPRQKKKYFGRSDVQKLCCSVSGFAMPTGRTIDQTFPLVANKR
jgi:hypothetical protein